MYDYANILFTGARCNLGCHGCIGEHQSLAGLPDNLGEFPPKNIDHLVEIVNVYDIPDLALTGTNTDPQLYRHEVALIHYLRERLTGRTRLSLHTNGLRAEAQMDVFNSYDKASVSYHSYDPHTYRLMTRTGHQPDIERILAASKIPVKLSMLVTEHNQYEIAGYILRSAELGVKRIVVRKPKGHDHEFPLEHRPPFDRLEPVKRIFSWPVYLMSGVEVTICGFDTSSARGVYLFSDGRVEDYLVR